MMQKSARNASDGKGMRMALDALVHLEEHGGLLLSPPITRDLVDALLAALRAHEAEAETLCAVCGAINTVLERALPVGAPASACAPALPVVCAQLEAGGALELLVALMRRHAGAAVLQTRACGVLGTLAALTAAAAASLAEAEQNRAALAARAGAGVELTPAMLAIERRRVAGEHAAGAR
jgi:hypothetical protein